MKPLRIRFVPRDEYVIDLEFLEKAIKRLLPCLKACERVEGQGELRLRYRIQNVSLASLAFDLEPVPIRGSPELAERAISRFPRTIEELESKHELPSDFTHEEAEGFRRLAFFAATRLTQLSVDGVHMTSQALTTLERSLRPKVSLGSVQGRLESVNIHDRWVFRIYLPSGASVECLFDRDMLPHVGEALGKQVTAWGWLSYPGSGLIPSRAKLLKLEICELSERPNKLSELCGILADSISKEFQGKTSEQIIREIRDADVE